MKLHLAAFLAALVLGLHVSGALAFDPWNVRWWPGTTPASSPMVVKVGATGVMTWEAVDSYGWPGWSGVVARALNTGASGSIDSEGNVINRFLTSENRGQIEIRAARAGETPDIRHYAVSTAFADAKCGNWGTACVYLLNERPVPAYYRAAAMIVWAESSQAPVVRHENFHALARACDQYRYACPSATTGVWEAGTMTCTGNPDTLMDCGGAARTVTAFDYATFVGAYAPSTGFLQVASPCSSDPCWDGARWQFSNGWSFEPVSGVWFNPQGAPEWLPCNADGLRWNPQLLFWAPAGAGFYQPARGFWSFAPRC